jgi:hypothetical protein
MSTAIAKSLEEAIERLRHDPVHPVEAVVGDLGGAAGEGATFGGRSVPRGWTLGGRVDGGTVRAARGWLASRWGAEVAAHQPRRRQTVSGGFG